MGVKASKGYSLLKTKSSYRLKAKPKIKGAISNVGVKELNFVDTTITNKAIALAGGTVTLLNGIAQADDYTDRNGRQAKMVNVQTHLVATAPAAHAGQLGRVLLVWDNAPNGVIATVAQIMASDSAAAFPKVDNAKRFTILRDIKLCLGTSVSTATQAMSDMNTAIVNEYCKVNSVTQFSDTGATIASIQNGALYLVTLGTGANTAQLNGSCRVRFTEK